MKIKYKVVVCYKNEPTSYQGEFVDYEIARWFAIRLEKSQGVPLNNLNINNNHYSIKIFKVTTEEKEVEIQEGVSV